jgi:hypothetical protein
VDRTAVATAVVIVAVIVAATVAAIRQAAATGADDDRVAGADNAAAAVGAVCRMRNTIRLDRMARRGITRRRREFPKRRR